MNSYLDCERDAANNPARAARGRVRRSLTCHLQSSENAIPCACDYNGTPILGLENDPTSLERLKTNPDVCLIYNDDADENYEVRIYGKARMTPYKRHRTRFLYRHPKFSNDVIDQAYTIFPELDGDTANQKRVIYRVIVEKVEIKTSDGQVTTLDSAAYILQYGDDPDITEIEVENLVHQNERHLDINQQLVTQILGYEDGEWLMTGLDPEGMDFRCGDTYCRLPYPEHVVDRETTFFPIGTYLKEARAKLGIDWNP
jgi:hypothetical protein